MNYSLADGRELFVTDAFSKGRKVLRAITPELICQAALLAATKEADAS